MERAGEPGKLAFFFRLSKFDCVPRRKLEAYDSFSKLEFDVADHWPIGMDNRLEWPVLGGLRPFRRTSEQRESADTVEKLDFLS